ncbi:hypothetical protein MB46_14600 [Arthrobacter alpinus]|uniref:hypothetical protein n=1 Tax=Arthrobacter alpinus TaxID=656366 RepID=UPI0005CA4E07|nr:hypothetical protein [Arthrobacter alpinus]ALV46539.1 hypothetical protein MB46_14600 [Arthrobacter alpinus]
MNAFRNKAILLPMTAGLLLALAGCSGATQASPPTHVAGSATTQAAPTTPAPATAPDAKEIFPKVTETVKSATSVSIAGDMSRGAESIKLKISGTRDGSNSLAEITMKGATSTLLTADGVTFLKADKEFFTQNVGQESADAIESLIGGKWITVTDAAMFGKFSIASLLDSFSAEGLEKSDFGKIADKSIVDLNGTKAFKYTAEEAILWIAAEGDPYLLQMQPQGSSSQDTGTMTFSEWNSVALQTAPAQDETISIPGL